VGEVCERCRIYEGDRVVATMVHLITMSTIEWSAMCGVVVWWCILLISTPSAYFLDSLQCGVCT